MIPRTRLVTALFAGAAMLAACVAPDAGAPDAGPPDAGPPDPRAARTDAPAESPLTAQAVGSPPLLTPEGWADLRIGMTRAEMVAAAGEDANPEAVGGPDPATCDELRPERAPEGMLVMLERGRVSRITLSSPAEVRTPSGIGIGDPASEVRAALGADVEAAPHQYLAPPAGYLTSWMGGARGADARGIRYEIGSDGRVLHIHAGGPSIEFVEGCV